MQKKKDSISNIYLELKCSILQQQQKHGEIMINNILSSKFEILLDSTCNLR